MQIGIFDANAFERIKQSLLGTLNALTGATVVLVFFLVAITFSTALGMRVPLIFVEFNKFASL
jgi:hypothetical protein